MSVLSALTLFLGLVQVACTNVHAMLPLQVDVTGEWRGEMVGRILHQGNTQHNNIALNLEQVGTQVSGTFIFLDVQPNLRVPVEGVVSGRKFTFTAEMDIEEGDYGFTGSCRVYVEASLVVAVTGQSMSGEKRLEHCDGTAVGTMSVARLGSEWIPPEIRGIPEPPPPALSLQAQSTKSKERSIQDWEEFSNYTLRLAEAMPEESYDYRPHPDQMSFGEQIIEIATMSEFFFARIVGRTANFSQGQIPEKNAAIQISKESFAFCISALRSMSEEQLESTHILRRGLQMSGRAIIEFALSHAIHHSGQAAAYLGAKGIKVPPFQPLFPY